MSERKKFPHRIEANTGGQWFMLNEDESPQRDDAEYIRADLAAERERELVGLLRSARCPDQRCDNEGTTVRMVERTVPECCGHFHDKGECCGNATAGVDAEPEPEPCQWCHERDAILAKLEQEK